MINYLLNHRGTIVQYTVALYTYAQNLFSSAIVEYSDSIVNKLIDVAGAVVAAALIYAMNKLLKRYWPDKKTRA